MYPYYLVTVVVDYLDSAGPSTENTAENVTLPHRGAGA
jgi:hypothetical protein